MLVLAGEDGAVLGAAARRVEQELRTIPGIGVPMCLISAELVLKRVRGDRSASPVAEPVGVRT